MSGADNYYKEDNSGCGCGGCLTFILGVWVSVWILRWLHLI